MKKLVLILSIVFAANIVFSQKISELRPTLIIWETNGKKVSLADSKYGVDLSDSIEFKLFFNKLLYDRIVQDKEITFEFRWYYYLSTSRKLMYIDKIDSKKFDNLTKNVLIVSSKQGVLSPGWWEVQVVCSYDEGFVEIGTVNKFQIFVNKKN